MRTLILGLQIATLALAGTDLTGKWAGGPLYVTLKQDGSALTGSAGTTEKEQYPLKSGALEGDHVTFELGSFQFEGRLDGAAIRGEVRSGGQTIPVILQRAEAIKQAPAPVFEVASVKVSLPGRGNSSMRLDPGRLTCTGVSLQRLLMRAYDVRAYQISGPDWLDEGRYELAAKFPAAFTTGQIVQALQALLLDRFRMTVHKESKEMPVYGLVVGKGGFKLNPAEMGPGGTSLSMGKLTAKKVPIARLADFLSQFVDRPVVDMTGLSGVYDFTLEWNQNAAEPTDTGPTADIYTAIQQQLGLKLETRRAPIEILVVDRAEKTPIDN